MEGLWSLRKSSLLSLSEQQLLDCSGSEGNEGCSGGYTSSAFDYVLSNGGVCSEAEYTYVGYQDDQCHDECATVVSITGHACVDAGNETALLQAVSVQPVAIAIEADQPVFQHYTGGVINDPHCGASLNHAVLIRRIRHGRGERTALLAHQEQLGHQVGPGRIRSHAARRQPVRPGFRAHPPSHHTLASHRGAQTPTNHCAAEDDRSRLLVSSAAHATLSVVADLIEVRCIRCTYVPVQRSTVQSILSV